MADITWSADYPIGAGRGRTPSCCEIGDNKSVLFYYQPPLQAGWGVVGTIAGGAISYGVPSAFCVDCYPVGDPFSGCRIGDDKVFVVYLDNADDNYYGRVGIITGTTIAWGPAVELFATIPNNEPLHPSCFAVSSDKIVTFAEDGGFIGSKKGYFTVCRIAGNNISGVGPMTQLPPVGGNRTPRSIGVRLVDDKFAAIVTDDFFNNVHVFVGTVAGLTPSYGAVIDVDPLAWGTCHMLGIEAMSSDKVVVSWGDIGMGDRGRLSIATISGTAITMGGKYTIAPYIQSYIRNVLKIDDTHFLVLYRTPAGTYTRYCLVSGTQITIGDADLFYLDVGGDFTRDPDMALVKHGRPIVVWYGNLAATTYRTRYGGITVAPLVTTNPATRS